MAGAARLSKILLAERIFCKEFSGPNAGSDRGPVETQMERKTGCYVINGQRGRALTAERCRGQDR